MALRKVRYRKALADVNMTNLIDIMMVLLIVFIWCQFRPDRPEHPRPQVSYVEAMGRADRRQRDPSGRKTLNGQPVTETDTVKRLAEKQVPRRGPVHQRG